MTERLYYDDPYLWKFVSEVTSCEPIDDTTSRVYLEKSAFYPTSGGQPYDTGTIEGRRVLDVYVDEFGDVAHVIEGSIETGVLAECLIDVPRRVDHMQQHAGEHILAGVMYRYYGAYTTGLHLGALDSTIDCVMPEGRMHLTQEEKAFVEAEVNRIIRSDAPIKCWFPGEEELKSLPLRKAPSVTEHIRVVQIGDDEFCACGGTHPKATGEIGLFKLTDARPDKGKLRLTFVCGERASRLFYRLYEDVSKLKEILNVPEEGLCRAAQTAVDKLKDAKHEANMAKCRMAEAVIRNELKGNEEVRFVFEDIGPEGLKAAADAALAAGRTALLADKTENGLNLMFASPKGGPDAGKLLKAFVASNGGKGGGSPELARGFCPDKDAAKALDSLRID
ncbi:MAG: alanyl-tRNA editing protein [Clostridiales bacterium]|nr:alanyl-tRNA editing protein [Clostridiales bacterium]